MEYFFDLNDCYLQNYCYRFATDINLMRIKLTGIKHEILRQGKGVRHTPNKLGTDFGTGTHDSSY